MADASAQSVVLEEFPLLIIVIISIFLVFAVSSVGIRTYMRLADQVFGLDDGLILAGLV